MTSIKELRLTHGELNRVSWICFQCKTEHTIDLHNSQQIQPITDPSKPYLCRVCGTVANENLRKALKHLYAYFGEANLAADAEIGSKTEIYFRVEAKD
jgi:hypothetical protein